MRCFKHPKADAVGICSSCHKGVCSKCAVKKGGKLYCRDCLSKPKFSEIKCYNHPMSEAVGMCSSCGKSICEACSIEKDGKLYCRLCSSQLPAEHREELEAAEFPKRKYEEMRPPESEGKPPEKEEMHPVGREEKHIPLSRVALSVKPSETVSSTIVGGIFGGFMMGLPFINLLMFWSAIGGLISVYLLKLRIDEYGSGYIERGDAIIVGAISGVFSALIATAFNVIYSVLLLDAILIPSENFLLSIGLDVGATDLIIKLAFTDIQLSAVFILIKLIATMILFAILGAVGGIVYSELSRR